MATGRDGLERAPSGVRLRDPEGLVGTLVAGRYRVVDVLARGGMGRIYRAVQEPLGRPVALKVLHAELEERDDAEEFGQRFFLEAATAARLRHPNIVVVHDYGRLSDEPGAGCYIAMELLEGRTLSELLRDSGPLPVERAVRIAREIARALREAHRHDVVHRDLKPSNVMIVNDAEGEHVKVLDFGLVKLARQDHEALTREGRFLGSPRYMAPEQIRKGPVDGRADLYALGVLLYQMLTGTVPFEGEQPVQTLLMHLNEPPPPLASRARGPIPIALEALVTQLLAKNPDDRPGSASEVIRRLDAVHPSALGSRSEDETLPSSPSLTSARDGSIATPPSSAALVVEGPAHTPLEDGSRTSRPSRRRRIVAAAVVAAAAVIAALLALRSPATPPPPSSPALVPSESARSITAPAGAPTAQDISATAPTTFGTAGRFALLVETSPPGARLLRDGVVLGITPVRVELDASSLSDGPARMRLELDGHRPHEWLQHPSTGDVVVRVSLEAEASATLQRPSRRADRGRRSPELETRANPRATGEPEGPSPAELGIKTSR